MVIEKTYLFWHPVQITDTILFIYLLFSAGTCNNKDMSSSVENLNSIFSVLPYIWIEGEF